MSARSSRSARYAVVPAQLKRTRSDDRRVSFPYEAVWVRRLEICCHLPDNLRKKGEQSRVWASGVEIQCSARLTNVAHPPVELVCVDSS